jgi:hypothetical protein
VRACAAWRADRRPGHVALALALLLALLSTAPISAQVNAETVVGRANPRTGLRGPLVATRVTEPFVLDGRVTEAAWLATEPLRAVVSEPNSGAEPSERTEFRIAYDDEYLLKHSHAVPIGW